MVSTSQAPLPDYTTMLATLQRCKCGQGPAELHGFALGLLVGDVTAPRAVWERELYRDFDPNDVLAGECRALLDRLFGEVFAGGPDTPLQLALLLPQDGGVSALRLAAVSEWCQGFLFGFGLGGASGAAALSDQTAELLGDFAEFTRLDTEDVEDSSENHAALIEIEEFIRSGVMVIHDERRAAHEREGH